MPVGSYLTDRTGVVRLIIRACWRWRSRARRRGRARRAATADVKDDPVTFVSNCLGIMAFNVDGNALLDERTFCVFAASSTHTQTRARARAHTHSCVYIQ